MEKYRVSPEIEKQIRLLAETYKFSMVVLFGSRAQLRDRKDSDVDVAYLRAEKLSVGDELRLARELELIFQAPRADVVYIPDASPLFMYLMLQEGVILFESDSTIFPTMYTYAIKRFHENLPLYQMRFDYLCRHYNVA